MTQLEIEAFLEIIHTGSLSAAAEQLYVTQPALSRRIQALEQEVGCPLFLRKKGQRTILLTPEGERFIPLARKWQALWKETAELQNVPEEQLFRLSAVGSVSTYIMPPVFQRFSEQSGHTKIIFNGYHSLESYHLVANGTLDLALISDDMYCDGVETVPAFQEPMLLAAGPGLSLPPTVDPSELDPRMELRLPWNPEYDVWHNYWFRSASRFRVSLDQMTLLEQLFSWPDSWSIVPESAARRISTLPDISLHHLTVPPPDRIIYYIYRSNQKNPLIPIFLKTLDQELKGFSGITSFLA